MGLFSLFRKNKQESASDQGEFRSRSEEQSSALRTRSSRAANTSGRASGGGRGKAGKDAGADPLLPEKKRARRRLIGAVALALAVVIVLPMILDSEPKPLNEDIAIQIPSKDQPATTAAATGAQPEPAQPAAAADTSKLASAASALDQKEEIVEPSSIAPAPAPVITPPAASVVPPKAVEKPAEKPAAKPEEKKPAVVQHKEEPKKEAPKKEAPKPKAAEQHGDDSARALAILEGKSSAAPSAADKKPAAAGGKFVIQVAALATQDKVNELRNKLNGAGIHSYTQKIATQGGDRTRIRVGPFGSRDEAEKMGARIKKLGLNATIVPA